MGSYRWYTCLHEINRSESLESIYLPDEKDNNEKKKKQ